ncbi:DNA circularization protein [Paraburkholderia adhaesiva]|uniref:DNA circularization protein n=1 Tax=Paraburkholderia adhaesiva TaxID=2883244 RepID=UPI001F35F8A2|nr:DNA circularization N-terminal domain-containing protein [Paraburkholderia adhaesiva]
MASNPSYRRASFRGCPFYYREISVELGRKTVVHTYPLRDKPFPEDLGRKEREYTIDGYLIGDDVLTQRATFEAALETKGPGTLVLPDRGELRASITKSTVSNRIDERGRIALKLTYVESGEDIQPDASTDTQQQISDAVSSAYPSLRSAFASAFAVSGLPDYALTAVISEAAYVVTTAQQMTQALLQDFDSYAASVADANALIASIGSQLTAPLDLAGMLVDVIQAIEAQIYPSVATTLPTPYGTTSTATDDDSTSPTWAQTPAPGPQAYQTMASLWTYTGQPASTPWPSSLAVTPTREQQTQAQQAVIDLVRGTAFLESAAAVAAIEFDSYDQSQQIQQQFFDAISDYMLEIDDDNWYFALKTVRAAVTDDITARGSTLARVRSVTLPQSAPALVVSYRLYGSPDSADDICARNAVVHPLQVPGGIALEVLTDG